MLRSVGALISGSLSDRYVVYSSLLKHFDVAVLLILITSYGRKYIMVVNLCLFIVFELASGFCNSLSPFLAVRALYGICMGGLLAPAAATALEDLPYEARGFFSGLFQQGYAVGYLLAALFFRALVPTTSHGWRSLFWFGACPPVLIIAWRLYLPETNYYQVLKAEREARHAQDDHADSVTGKTGSLRAFLKDANQAFRKNWVLFVYMVSSLQESCQSVEMLCSSHKHTEPMLKSKQVILMSGMNSVSHGSQDLFPTFLSDQARMGDTM